MIVYFVEILYVEKKYVKRTLLAAKTMSNQNCHSDVCLILAPIIPVRVCMTNIIRYLSTHTVSLNFYIHCERIFHYMFRPIMAIHNQVI